MHCPWVSVWNGLPETRRMECLFPPFLFSHPGGSVVPRVWTMRLVAQARKSQRVWTIIGLDGTTFQLPVDEMANVATTAKNSQKNEGFPFARWISGCGFYLLARPPRTWQVSKRSRDSYVQQIPTVYLAGVAALTLLQPYRFTRIGSR